MEKYDHQPGYRHDITGLRALAVLSVVAYHFGISQLSGGFVGVDIFFVISGFVITRVIRDEYLSTNNFNFGRFYLKRVRRLFPSLLATVALTFSVASFALSPQYLELFAKSVFAAIFSFSNVQFWRESGYFDESSLTKPLLHTWSLSVEEQFYLVWPAMLVLMLLMLKRRAIFGLVFVGLLSLAANFLIDEQAVAFFGTISTRLGIWLAKGSTTIFYLTPFRVFEFTIGAIVVWLLDVRQKKALAELAVVTGLLIILFCLITYSEQMFFPSYNAILPCFGAALVIYGGGRARYAGAVLRHPVAILVGELSYVIYLVHWPVVIFFRYYYPKTPLWEALGILIATTAMFSWLIHIAIEVPFRRPLSVSENLFGRFGQVCAMATVVVLVPAATAMLDGGWPWRVPDEVRNIAATEQLVVKETIDLNQNGRPYDHAFSNDGRRRLLIIGDSMADDFSLALRLGGWVKDIDLEVLNISHICQFFIGDRKTVPDYPYGSQLASSCGGDTESVISTAQSLQPDVIIVAQNWYDWVPEAGLNAAISALTQRRNVPVYVMSKRRWFKPKISTQVLERGTLKFANADAFAKREPGLINAMVKRAAEANGARFISWDSLVCSAPQEICFAIDDGNLLYRDEVHFSIAGARLFGARMREIPEYRAMLLGPGNVGDLPKPTRLQQ